MCDGEEKKLFRALRKRRHQKRAKERDQKWSNFAKKQKKRKKKEKKSRPFPFAFVCTRNTQREREKAVKERKKR
jgi:hypothetical protein